MRIPWGVLRQMRWRRDATGLDEQLAGIGIPPDDPLVAVFERKDEAFEISLLSYEFCRHIDITLTYNRRLSTIF